MSIFAISDKLSLESTGGISRGFMQEGVMAIPASLPQLNSMTMGALSGQQVQADSLTKNTQAKLNVLSKGDNVIIPIPSVDRGPADERSIKGVVMNVNEHGGYMIGTKVGLIKLYMSRNQVHFDVNICNFRQTLTKINRRNITRIYARRCHGDTSFITTA
jgi:hypothetical protein